MATAPGHIASMCRVGAWAGAEMERLPQGYGGIRLDPTTEAISSGRYGAVCVDSDHTVDAPELPSDLPGEDILLLPLSVCMF